MDSATNIQLGDLCSAEDVRREFPTILALTGQRYSGKSLVADMVCSLDERFQRYSFATVLRQEVSELYGIPMEEISSSKTKEKYRELLVRFGWEKKRADPYYFARRLFDSIDGRSLAVIDDLRFVEELDLALQAYAVVFRVFAEPSDRHRRGWRYQSGVDDDPSETEMDLSAETLYMVTGGRGGWIFNSKDDKEYLRQQVSAILNCHFPPVVGARYKELLLSTSSPAGTYGSCGA